MIRNKKKHRKGVVALTDSEGIGCHFLVKMLIITDEKQSFDECYFKERKRKIFIFVMRGSSHYN